MAKVWIKTIETKGVLGLWKLEEPTENLLSVIKLPVKEQKIFDQFTSPRRQKEWLATRALLQEILGFYPEIKYNDVGHPELQNAPYELSISHSKNFVGVLIHPSKHTALDIESTTRKIEHVATKFLSREELNFCHAVQRKANFRLFIHWCAKETIYKLMRCNEIDFAQQIHIIPFQEEDEMVHGDFNGTFTNNHITTTINLHYHLEADDLIVWSLL